MSGVTDRGPSIARRPVLTTSEGINRGVFAARDWLTFASIGLIWGSSFLFIAIGLDAFGPGSITWLRVIIGGAVLWCFPSARAPVAREDRLGLLAISILWVAVPFTLFPIAEQHLTSALVGLINGALPIFAAIVGAVMLRRLPGRAHLVGLAVGFAGIVAIAVPAAAQGSSQAIGVVQALAAVVCYAFASNIAAPITQRYGSVPVMARMLALGAVWTAPFGLWSIPGSRFAWGPALAMVALGGLGTGVAFALMGHLVARVGGTRAAFAVYLVPVVAMVLGAVFLQDPIYAISVVGIGLVIGGAILASRKDPTASSGRMPPP